MPRLRRRLLFTLPLLLGVTTGCRAFVDLLDGESEATVKMFAAHAGTPGEDGFPSYGDSENARVFVNDQGWEITLAEVYVTTAEVRLVKCSADAGTAIEMFWGPCAENFIAYDDRQTLPLGAVTVTDGEYCRVDVSFAPYVADASASEHIVPDNPAIEGNTVFVRGVARRGDAEEVQFELTTDETVVAQIDISTLEGGGPMTLHEESFPRDLTLLKTYDSFFMGVDFATAGDADIAAAILAGLELDTRVYDGTTI